MASKYQSGNKQKIAFFKILARIVLILIFILVSKPEIEILVLVSKAEKGFSSDTGMPQTPLLLLLQLSLFNRSIGRCLFSGKEGLVVSRSLLNFSFTMSMSINNNTAVSVKQKSFFMSWTTQQVIFSLAQ